MEPAPLVPCSCPCCTSCKMIMVGVWAGSCIYGGPFTGYVVIDQVGVAKEEVIG